MATNYKTVGQLFSESSAAVQRNLRLFISLNILTILSTAWGIGLVLRDKASGHDWASVIGRSLFDTNSDYKLNATFNTILGVAGIVLALMAMVLAVKVAQHKTVEFDEVWGTFKAKWWRIILTIVIIVIPIILGLILLIIPGLYLMSRLDLAPYVVIDQNVSPMEAANKSWEMTKNRAWPVFIAIFFGLVLSLPTIVPIIGPIVALVLTIAYSVGMPIRYFEYKKDKVHAKA